MKEKITNEKIEYKAGFIAGRNEVLKSYSLGKEITSESETTDDWFSYGYTDGKACFKELINEGKTDMKSLSKNELLDMWFNNRIVKYSENNKEENSRRR